MDIINYCAQNYNGARLRLNVIAIMWLGWFLVSYSFWSLYYKWVTTPQHPPLMTLRNWLATLESDSGHSINLCLGSCFISCHASRCFEQQLSIQSNKGAWWHHCHCRHNDEVIMCSWVSTSLTFLILVTVRPRMSAVFLTWVPPHAHAAPPTFTILSPKN